MILQIQDLVAGYGASVVVHGLSMEIADGEVVCLLGRNGAGKTTTLQSIIGLTPPHSGSIRFGGRELAGLQPFEIARAGIGYVPDSRRIFPDLTVEENLMLAQRTAGTRTGQWTVGRIYLLFPVLQPLRRLHGSHLSGGQQKMLALGRALMKNPALLLLDEPAEGLAPLVVHGLIDVLREIQQTGVTILLADQNLNFCRKVADRAYIIEKGLMQFAGTMEAVWRNRDVIQRYLAV